MSISRRSSGTGSTSTKKKVGIKDPVQKKAKANPANKATAAEKAANNKARKAREAKKTPQEKQHDAARAKHLREKREGTSGKKPAKTPKERLNARIATWDQRRSDAKARSEETIKRLDEKEKAHGTWLAKKQKVESDNIGKRYAAARSNVSARANARLKTMMKRKPKLENGKVVVPKVEAIAPKLRKPKLGKIPAKPAILTAKKRAGKSSGSTKPASGTKPAGTKPAGTKPAGTKPAGTKPAGTKPAGTKPAGTKPAGTKPASGSTKPATGGRRPAKK